MAFWQAALLLVLGTLASVIGSSILRHAALVASPTWTVAGIALWVMSGLSFVHLAREMDLGKLGSLDQLSSVWCSPTSSVCIGLRSRSACVS